MNQKISNPKDAVGIKKAYQSVLPLPVLYEAGLAMLEGALKYGRHNYRAIGVRGSTYYDACRRHLDEWWEGVDFDKPSKIHNLSKAIACLLVLRDAEMRGMLNDDRPPASDPDWLEKMNEAAKDLVESMPDAKEPYTQKARQSGVPQESGGTSQSSGRHRPKTTGSLKERPRTGIFLGDADKANGRSYIVVAKDNTWTWYADAGEDPGQGELKYIGNIPVYIETQ